jgi:hypothetical protein
MTFARFKSEFALPASPGVAAYPTVVVAPVPSGIIIKCRT